MSDVRPVIVAVATPDPRVRYRQALADLLSIMRASDSEFRSPWEQQLVARAEALLAESP